MFRPLFAQTVLSRKVITLAGVAVLALQISACTPTVETRGNLLSPTKIEQVEVSQSIRKALQGITLAEILRRNSDAGSSSQYVI